jgi:hypothetical protein
VYKRQILGFAEIKEPDLKFELIHKTGSSSKPIEYRYTTRYKLLF